LERTNIPPIRVNYLKMCYLQVMVTLARDLRDEYARGDRCRR
jgi:hypothetical protein